MSNILKRITSTILAFVMVMSCIVINTAGETAETLYKFYANTTDATANGDSASNNAKTVFTNAGTGTTNFTSGTYTVEGKDYTLTKAYSQSSFTIVVPNNVVDATLTIVAKSSNSSTRKLTLKKNNVVLDATKTVTDATVVSYTGLSTGTYTLSADSSVYYSLLTLKVPLAYKMSGTVTDNTGTAVKCATVSVGENYKAQTDSKGQYSVVVRPGSYSANITALGYSSSEETDITVDKDITKNFTIEKGKGVIYKFFANSTDAITNYDSTSSNATSVFTNVSTGTASITEQLVNLGGSSYKLSHYNSSNYSKFTIVVPQAVANAELHMAFKVNTANDTKLTLSKNGTVVDTKVITKSANIEVVDFTGLSEGTYTLASTYTTSTSTMYIYPALFILSTSPVHTLSGTVLDDSGIAVKSATINVNDKYIARTNASGKYSLVIPEGDSTIKVTALNYTSADEITIPVKDDITKDFTLKKGNNTIYKFYGNTDDATANYDSVSNNATSVFTGLTTSTNTITEQLVNLGGSSYKLSHYSTNYSKFTIVVPDAVANAELHMAFRVNTGNDTKLTLSKDGEVVDTKIITKSTNIEVVDFTGLSYGTYTLTSTYTTSTSTLSVYPSLFILSTSPVHTVSGTVTDDSGKVVKCATITVNDKLTARTNSSGKYTITVPEGTDTINVTALGYSSSEKITFDVNKDEVKDFTIEKKKGDIYTFYGNTDDATANYDSINNNAKNIFTTAVTNTYSYTSGVYNLGGSSYSLSHAGNSRADQTIAVPSEVADASLYMVLRNSSSYDVKLTLSKDGTVIDDKQVISKTSMGVITYTGLSGGTYTLTSTYGTSAINLYPMMLILSTSPTYELSGTVTNDLGEAVKCATVIVNDTLKTRTDGNGKYSIKVPEGTNTVKVTAFYHSNSEEVTIKSNKDLTQDFTLKRNKGEIYKFYGAETAATANYDKISDNASDVFTTAVVSTYNFTGGDYNIDGSTYTLNSAGSYRSNQTIVVPFGVADASLHMVLRNTTADYNARLVLSKNGEVVDNTKIINKSTIGTVNYTGLSGGTYTLTFTYETNSTQTLNLYPVLFMLTTSPVHTLTGTVTDDSGAVVKRATITVNDNLTTRTDGKGNYSINVPEGTNTIKVTAFNYDDKKGAETLDVNSDITKNFVLYKQSGELYEFYGSEVDATANYDSVNNNAKDVFTTAVVTTNSFLAGTYNIGGSTYNFTQSASSLSVQKIVVPFGVANASLHMAIYNYSGSDVKLILSKDGKVVDDSKIVTKTSAEVVNYAGLSGGTYTLTSVDANNTSTSLNTRVAYFALKTSPVHTVTGTVTDDSGAVVKCATITVNDNLIARTDGNGNYSINVPEGTDTIKVTALGYTDEVGEETITVNNDITKDFVLSKNKGIIYKFFSNSYDLDANYVSADNKEENATDIFTNAVVNNSTTINATAQNKGLINVGGSSYAFSYYPRASNTYTIVVPDAVESATLHMLLQTYNNDATPAFTTLTLSKDGTVVDNSKKIAKNTIDVVEYENLSGGTYTLTYNYSVYYHLLVLETTPTHTVSGIARDDTGTPIKRATVTVNGRLITRTDDKGKYSIDVPEGVNEISVAALGYIYYEGSAKISTYKDMTKNFVLSQKNGKIYTFYSNPLDKDANYASAEENATDVFTSALVTDSTNINTVARDKGLINVDGSSYTFSHYPRANTTYTIVVPDAVENATLHMLLQTYNNDATPAFTTLTLSKDGTVVDNSKKIAKNTIDVVEYENLSGGTYTLTCDYSVYYHLLVMETSPTHMASGQVTNSVGEPIKCATITTSVGLKTRTDESGKYSIAIPEGSSSIKVTAFGYSEAEEKFTTDEDVEQDFILRKNRGEVYKFYGNQLDAEADYDSIDNNATDVFTNFKTSTSTSTIKGGPYEVNGSTYDLKHYGTSTSSLTLKVPEGVANASLYMVVRCGGYDSELTLSKDGVVVDDAITANAGKATTFSYNDLSEGTYTLTCANTSVSVMLAILATSPVYTISGTVTNTEGTLVKCATVYIDGKELITDGNGRYSVDVAEGKVIDNIRVTALGCKDYEESVSISGETTKDIVIHKNRNDVYMFFGNEKDAITNYDNIANNATGVFKDTVTYTSRFTERVFDIDGSTYKCTYSGRARSRYTIVVPEGVTAAELYMAVTSNYGSAIKFTLSRDGNVVDDNYTLAPTSSDVVTYKNLKEGTYTLTTTANVYPTLLVLTTSPVYTLSGTVTDNAGSPVKCAYIELDNGLTMRTDGDGKYAMDIAADTIINNITVTAMGYEDSDEAVCINEDTTRDIVLTKKSDTYKFFVNENDATANYTSITGNSTSVFTNATLGSSKVTGANTYNVGGSLYKMNYLSGNVTSLEIVVPKNHTNAKLYVVGKSYRNNYTTRLTLSKNGNVWDNQKTLPGSKMSIITYDGLDEGTYTLKGNYAFRYTFLAVAAEEKEVIESTTETTTEGPVNVRVNRGDNSTAESVNVVVKKNGELLENITSLNIGSNTEIGKLKRNDVLTFTFDEETAKKITNWSGFKSTLNDKTYTLTYRVNSTSSIPVMYYYDEMSTINLGRTSAIAASYGGYGFGRYDAMIAGRNLKSYTVIKGHRYSLYDVGDGIYDKDGTEHGVANETVLLLGESDDKVVVKNNIAPTTKALVVLDCSKEDAVVTAEDGTIYSDYDGTNATEVESIVGKTENKKKLQFYIDGGTTLSIKGTDTDNYSVLRSVRIFDVNNITTGVTAIDNGLVSDISTDTTFADVVAGLDATDRVFTLVGMVNGDYRDNDFMKQINNVGFVLYDADVVDGLGEDAKNMNPQQLQTNYAGTNFGEETIKANTVYKNFYDVNQYDETLDEDKNYTGATSQEEGDDKSYFAYLVALSEGKRYYAYPFTTYSGASQSSFDATVENKIEMSNN